jgi:hypothetical protein
MTAAVARGADVDETTGLKALAEISGLKRAPPEDVRETSEALAARIAGALEPT